LAPLRELFVSQNLPAEWLRHYLERSNKWFLFCGICGKQKSVIQNRELIASTSSLRLCVKNLLKGGGS
jgi:hypothetical protein